MISRRTMLAVASSITLAVFSGISLAQGPVKVGMSMPQTGSLGAGGKAALLALQIWVEDVNKRGGLLGRKVDFIVYDDQTNPALTPSIYTKLLDVDKVDLLIAPYGTVPTAPIMPLVKQRGLAAAAERAGLGDSDADLDGLLRQRQRAEGNAQDEQRDSFHDLLLVGLL